MAVLPQTPDTSAVPPEVPDHELLRLIGRGSYGEVWLARNIMGAWRAVKVVRRDTFSSERPFEREFGGIQRYEPISRSAEGVVPILHVGRTADGFHYVMEVADDAVMGPPGIENWDIGAYVPRTLRSDLQRLGRLPIAECLELGQALATGLAHLHRHGLVHRDLKPSNLIFVNGRAKLADLGLVGSIDETRSFVGTLGYIPPEGPGSATADIFALGRVLYEAATGLPADEFPNPPPDWLSGEIPHGALELHEVILRACETDASRRYQSAAALQADLALLQSGQSVRAARKLERRVKTLRRAGSMAAAAAVVALALVLVALLRARSERANADQANRLRQRAESAELASRQQLSETQLARAGLMRRSGLVGQRIQTLELLRNAAREATQLPELRTEAIAANALTDLLELQSRTILGPSGMWCTMDATLSRYTRAHADGSVWIHDWNPDQERVQLAGARAEGLLVWPFSDRGNRLGGQRGSHAFVWDTRTGRLVFDRDLPDLMAVDLTPDGDTALLRTMDGRIHSFRLADGSAGPVLDFEANDGQFWTSPDGKRLALTSPSRCELRLADFTAMPQRVFQLPPPACPQNFLWTPDSRGLLIAGDDFRGYFLRLDRPEFRAVRLIGHQAEIVAGVMHPSRPFALSSSWDGTTRLWNLETGRQLLRVPLDGTELRWNATNRVAILKKLGEGEFRISEFEAFLPMGAQILTEPLPPRDLSANKGTWNVAFVAEGHALAVASYDGIRLWPLSGGDALFLPLGWCRWLEADATGSTLWISTQEQVLKLQLRWDATTRSIQVGKPEPTPIRGREIPIAMTHSGSGILCARDQQLIHFSATGEPRILGTLPDTTTRLYTSPDGRWILSGDYHSSELQLVSAASMKPLRTLRTGVNPHALFFGNGEEVLLTSGGELRRERTMDGALRWKVPRPGPGTASGPMAVAPDGRTIAISLGQREVTLLNAETGERYCSLDAPDQGIVHALRFSPDGLHLAAATSDHAAVLWNLAEVRSELKALNLDWAAPALSLSTNAAAAGFSSLPEDLHQAALPPVLGAVDFSGFFTHTLANYFSNETDNRFSDLKPGRIRAGAIDFQVQGILQLGGLMLPQLPRGVAGIPIHRQCRRVHFLHASTWDGPAVGEIGHYTLHFRDGSTETIPLIHGVNIHDWWVDPEHPPRPAPVWTGANAHLRSKGWTVGLFHLAWDNPHPEREIAFLSFETDGKTRLPLLAALSTE